MNAFVENVATATIAAAARNNIAPSLNYSSYLSPPFPVSRSRKIKFCILIGRAEVTSAEASVQMWAPELAAMFHPASSQLDELRSISPEDFRLSLSASEPIAQLKYYLGEWDRKRAEEEIKLYQLCDLLVDCLLTGQDVKKSLTVFNEQFVRVCEPAILPFYQKLAVSI